MGAGGGDVGVDVGAGGRVWSVVVVDDEEDLRRLVQLTLQFDDELRVVAVACDADEALALVRETAPDLVVLDHLLGGPVTGLQVAGRLRADLPGTRVILFSAGDAVIDVRDSSVDAVVSKMDLGTLPDVARRVLASAAAAASA
jgi:DNA-binding NarL/FixJ family response regulator